MITDLLNWRFACKKFSSKKIPAKHFEQLKQAIRLAPSSMNGQPWKVKIIEDNAIKQQLGPYSRHNAEKIMQCSHLLVFSTVNDQKERFEDLATLMALDKNLSFNAERYKTMIPKFFAAKLPEDIRRWQERQTFLPLMSLMLVAAELGIDSCPMEGFEPDDYMRILNITDARPLVLCALGYRDMQAPQKIRLLPQDIFS